jgi:hypothetical protein
MSTGPFQSFAQLAHCLIAKFDESDHPTRSCTVS